LAVGEDAVNANEKFAAINQASGMRSNANDTSLFLQTEKQHMMMRVTGL
jgi:hypothetical protein